MDTKDMQIEFQKTKIVLSNIIEEFVQGNFQAGKNPYAVPMLTDAMKMLAKQAGVKDYMETHVVKERLERQMDEHFKWRLPTIDELQFIYQEKEKIGNFDESSNYWSSTEYNSNSVYSVGFYNSNTYNGIKDNYSHVRLVRSLPIKNLSISPETQVGHKFELDGEPVVFASVDENGLALIVATQDEPNPMTWDEAMQAADEEKLE